MLRGLSGRRNLRHYHQAVHADAEEVGATHGAAVDDGGIVAGVGGRFGDGGLRGEVGGEVGGDVVGAEEFPIGEAGVGGEVDGEHVSAELGGGDLDKGGFRGAWDDDCGVESIGVENEVPLVAVDLEGIGTDDLKS